MKKILILLLVFAFTSCGTRKVEINKAKEETKIDSVATTTTEQKQEVKNDVVTLTETHEVELSPIDTTKPIVYNGVLYYNAKIVVRAEKENKTDKSIVVASQKQKAIVSKSISKEKITYAKETERTSFPWYWLLLLLIPIGYYLYKKYPDKFRFLKAKRVT
jgi:hypothetical protein